MIFVMYMLLLDANMASGVGSIIIAAACLGANLCMFAVVAVDTRSQERRIRKAISEQVGARGSVQSVADFNGEGNVEGNVDADTDANGSNANGPRGGGGGGGRGRGRTGAGGRTERMVVEMTQMAPAHREGEEQGGEGWVENPLAKMSAKTKPLANELAVDQTVEIAVDDSVELVDTSDGVVGEATQGGGSPDAAASEADEGEREGGGDGGRTKRGWSMEVDPSTGNTYYYNDEGTVTWEKPADYQEDI